jgi:hypothetical protein
MIRKTSHEWQQKTIIIKTYILALLVGRPNKIVKRNIVFSVYYEIISNSTIDIIMSWVLFNYT